MKILVTGAAGQMGGVVIENLLKKIPAQQINTLTRKAEKQLEFQTKGFNSFLGDYNDIASLEKAMSGVDRGFLPIPPKRTDKENKAMSLTPDIALLKLCSRHSKSYSF